MKVIALIFIFPLLLVFAGCDRENIDETILPTPEQPLADTTLCSLGLEIFVDSTIIDSSGTLTLRLLLSTEALPPLEYVWSDSSSADFLEVPPMGDYEVTVTDAMGCVENELVSL